jgi:predicted ATP-grasp superfamily ATP-dependent carboligase
MNIKSPNNIFIVTDCVLGNIFVHINRLKKNNFTIITFDRFIKKKSNKKTILVLSDINKILPLTDPRYHEAIKTLYYKNLFASFMLDNFPDCIPMTYFSDPIKFPCIMKPINGIGGKDIIIFQSKVDYDNSPIKFNNNYIIQDYLFTEITSTAHFLCYNGKIIMSVKYTAKTPEKYHVQKGNIVNYIKEELGDKEKLIFSSILAKLNYDGLCCIDYYFNGIDLKIYEINPRIGGSLVDNENDFFTFINQIKEDIKKS